MTGHMQMSAPVLTCSMTSRGTPFKSLCRIELEVHFGGVPVRLNRGLGNRLLRSFIAFFPSCSRLSHARS